MPFGWLLASATMPVDTLPFSVWRLLFLLVWVYLCLYLVQRVEDSPLVPGKYKSVLHVATLFVGPLVFVGLVFLDAKKSSGEGGSFSDLLGGVKRAFRSIWRSRVRTTAEDTALRLFDSTGTELSEIYGHGEKGGDRHVLELTVELIENALAAAGQRHSRRSQGPVIVYRATAHRRHVADRPRAADRHVQGRYQQRQGRLQHGHFRAASAAGRRLHRAQRRQRRFLPRGYAPGR